MKKIIISLLYLFVMLPSFSQEVRVYRPDVTAKNYEKPKSNIPEELVFTLKQEFVRDVTPAEKRLHVRLNHLGREELYFYTSARKSQWLNIRTPEGLLFNRLKITEPLATYHLVSQEFQRRYDLAKVAKSFKSKK